jgi:hypothetical protein
MVLTTALLNKFDGDQQYLSFEILRSPPTHKVGGLFLCATYEPDSKRSIGASFYSVSSPSTVNLAG